MHENRFCATYGVLTTDCLFISGQLITLGQFVFVAIEGLFHHVQWPSARGCWWWPTFLPSLKPRAVPIQRWFILVVVFYIVSALNNIALGFSISMPLHIIFRSGGLIVNMFMGWLLLSKRYICITHACIKIFFVQKSNSVIV